MTEKAVHLLVVDGFADWEPAHAVAELRRAGHFRVETVGLTRSPVQSMGGLSVLPTTTVATVDPSDAGMGLLRGRRHTSNGLDYLRSHAPGYDDAAAYVDAPAVRDRALITASGLADVEFARELFEELNVFSPDDRALWAEIFRTARMP